MKLLQLLSGTPDSIQIHGTPAGAQGSCRSGNQGPCEPHAADSRLTPLLLATDSSIVYAPRPLFLPEISERWQGEIYVAYRISRLGKSIPARFASRHYDAMTLAARFCPIDLMEALAAYGERYSPRATAFDGALAVGRWIDAAPATLISAISPAEAVLDPGATGTIDDDVADLSRDFILKTGDIIIPRQTPLPFCPAIGASVKASLNNQDVLTFNIK